METNGYKKIAFIQNISEQLFGYMHLASFLKPHGHVCSVFVDAFEKDITGSLKEFQPDILGFSCVTGNLDWGLSIIRGYKKYDSNCLTLLGGPHPTNFPSVVTEEGIDAICIGESEETLLEICEKYDGSLESIRNVYNVCTFLEGKMIKKPLRHLIEDLDSLPLPDRSLYDRYSYFRNLNTISIFCSRGCPFKCSYCYSHKLNKLYKNLGKYVRFRSPQHIIEELKSIIEKYKNINYISFQDSTFNTNHKWLINFLNFYRHKINLPFFCQIRADVTNAEQIDSLAVANCRVVAFGIEGGSYRLRKEILKRDMSDEVIIETAKQIKDRNMLLCTANIFGLPTETLEESYQLVDINQRVKPDLVGAHVFQPYPGTELSELALKKGLVEQIDYNSLHNYYHHSILKQKDIREQERIHKLLFYFVKFPKLTSFWKYLIQKAPFSLLYALFLASLTATYKMNFGYSTLGIIKFCFYNLKLFAATLFHQKTFE